MRLTVRRINHITTVWDKRLGECTQTLHGSCRLGHPIVSTRDIDGTIILLGGLSITEAKRAWKHIDANNLAPNGLYGYGAITGDHPKARVRGVRVDFPMAVLD